MTTTSVLCALLALSMAAGSAAESVDCSGLVLSMADCLPFVTEGSTTRKPEGKCCSGLKTVLKTGAECLCEAFRNSAQLGVTLNVSKAVALPSACHVSAPPLTSCGLSIGSGSAPAPALIPPAVSPSSSTSADKVAPAPAPAAAGAPSIAASALLLVLSAAATAASF